MITISDREAMAEAIRLSRLGFPPPNPHVGCVIVKDNEIIGRGYHIAAGLDHAEAMALKEAGGRAKGATVYVTQMPCNNVGRTPACSHALVAAGIKRVVVATDDPNPKMQGGAETLRAAGIAVECGLMEPQAELANAPWLIAMRRERPFVTLKSATTQDGFIARPDGTSKWITNEASRADGHRLRAERGAVLVGVNTVLVDNPTLTARIEGVVNQPACIILDPNQRLTGKEAIFGSEAETLWLTRHELSSFDIPSILDYLWTKGINGVLVEGGARTVTEFLRSGLADDMYRYIAPIQFGDGLRWLPEQDESQLADCLRETVNFEGNQRLHFTISREIRNIYERAEVKR